MTSIELAFLLIAILGIIILVMLGKYLKLAKSNKNHLGRIKTLEGEMELLRTQPKSRKHNGARPATNEELLADKGFQ